MPTIANARYPEPTSWIEFENICRDSFGQRWENENLVKHGRQGQAQQGVDIYGCDRHNSLIGIQCKNTTGAITEAIINSEIENAEKFTPPIKALYIATTCSADAQVQKNVRAMSNVRVKQGQFGVEIVFWSEIVQDLSRSRDLVAKHYPQFFGRNGSEFHRRDPTTFVPPQVSVLDQNGNPTRDLLLPFRRVRVPEIQSLPEFVDRRWWLMQKLGGRSNPKYWRELATSELIRLSSAWVDLEIINTSNTYLTECTVQIRVATPHGQPLPARTYMPETPVRYGNNEKWRMTYAEFVAAQKNPSRDLQMTEMSTASLRPGDRSGFSYGLLLYFGDHDYLHIKYRILAKELSKPAEGVLIVATDDVFECWTFEQLQAHASLDVRKRCPRFVRKAKGAAGDGN